MCNVDFCIILVKMWMNIKIIIIMYKVFTFITFFDWSERFRISYYQRIFPFFFSYLSNLIKSFELQISREIKLKNGKWFFLYFSLYVQVDSFILIQRFSTRLCIKIDFVFLIYLITHPCTFLLLTKDRGNVRKMALFIRKNGFYIS